MAESFSCQCDPKNANNWRVIHYMHNHSYFESPKGAEHHSKYSTVGCLKCGRSGRTRAKYVGNLKHMEPVEFYSSR